MKTKVMADEQTNTPYIAHVLSSLLKEGTCSVKNLDNFLITFQTLALKKEKNRQ